MYSFRLALLWFPKGWPMLKNNNNNLDLTKYLEGHKNYKQVSARIDLDVALIGVTNQTFI